MRFLAAVAFAALATLAAAQDPAFPKPSDKEAEEKVKELKGAFEKGTDEEKKAAVEGCVDCPHPNVATALAPVLVSGPNELRLAAAKTLGQMPGLAEAARGLHAALKPNEKDDKVLRAMFEGIARVGHASSVAVCRKWIDDRLDLRDSEEVPGVIHAFDVLGYLKFKDSVEAILDLCNKKKVSGWNAGSGGGYKWKCGRRAEAALVRLTGQEPFGDLELWKDWWDKHAKDFNADMTPKK